MRTIGSTAAPEIRPVLALVRAAVAADHCREELRAGRETEATMALGRLREAITDLSACQLDAATAGELHRLMTTQSQLAGALRALEKN